ncbi:hypothetical protein DRQ33_02835 [bacterium]|nr:MAG: hypothetical protein DRQ33_02835 [bacterium]
MIRIRDLTKLYDHKKALDSISFDVNNGEILGFLGPNGAGKTTTMKIITCYMPPTSGIVEVDELNIFEHPMEIRKKIGYLPETNPLYTDMYVLDYLKFVADIRNIPRDKQKERIDYVIETCGLADELTKDIGALSQGYRQRVGLAQTLIHNPEILILDEPTLGLDPNQIMEITDLIKQIGKEKTVMVSTHILPWVQANCDRMVIIDNGKIVADGTFDELRSNYPKPDEIDLERIFHDLTIQRRRKEQAVPDMEPTDIDEKEEFSSQTQNENNVSGGESK